MIGEVAGRIKRGRQDWEVVFMGLWGGGRLVGSEGCHACRQELGRGLPSLGMWLIMKVFPYYFFPAPMLKHPYVIVQIISGSWSYQATTKQILFYNINYYLNVIKYH